MSIHDFEMAHRSVRYLRSNRLRPEEIEAVLREEFDCSPELASRLVATAA